MLSRPVVFTEMFVKKIKIKITHKTDGLAYTTVQGSSLLGPGKLSISGRNTGSKRSKTNGDTGKMVQGKQLLDVDLRYTSTSADYVPWLAHTASVSVK